MPLDDPWLSQRMADYTTVRRAENELHPAVRQAVAAFITATTQGILGTTTAAATARFQNGDDEPDLNGFPDDTAWRRLVDRFIAPVSRSLWERAYTALTGTSTAAQAAASFAADTATRVAGFPRAVYQRLRAALSTGRERAETPAQLRARVAELMTLEEWDGQTLTMTRTEVMTALNAGALAGALDEQARTGEPWTKRWQATRDARVRPTHAAADGQLQPLTDPFTVGGATLQFPGDPRGPAAEVINCRCSCRYAPTGDPSLTASLTRRTP